MNPQIAPPSWPRWPIATVFAVFADISGTLAQYLPMKSIFILAADEIPPFYRRFLVDLGTTLTALVLIGVVALFTAPGTSTKKLSGRLVERKDTLPGKEISLSDRSQIGRPPITFSGHQAEGIVLVLLVAAATIALPFAGAILGWMALSGLVLRLRIRRRPRRPGYHTAPPAIEGEYTALVTGSALWVAVGPALVTLIFAVPSTGVIGILLVAVVLQRFQRALGERGLRHVRVKKSEPPYSRESSAQGVVVSDVPLLAPLDSLAPEPAEAMRIFPQLRKRFLTGPSIYSLGGPVGPAHLVKLGDGTVEPSYFSELSVSPLRVARSESPHREGLSETTPNEHPTFTPTPCEKRCIG